MKKAITVICIAVLLCVVLCGCGGFRLISIGNGDAGNFDSRFDNGASYSYGSAEITDSITDVEIEWASGSVDITCGGDKISFEESANKELTDENRMVWSVQGSQLVIKFARDNSFHALWFSKTLRLTLPEAFCAESFCIDCASADTNADSLCAKRLELSSASGKIVVGSIDANDVEISAASGNVDIAQSGSCGELDISTASGKVSAKLDEVRELGVDTSSGEVNVSANMLGRAGIDTASGDVRLTVFNSFDNTEIETASGAVSLFLPESQGLTAEIDTASGKLDSDIPITFKSGNYVCGDGSARLEIDTASGDITLGRAK